MRSLVKAEFKKIWANPFVLVIIAGLLFFQGCMVFYTLNKKGEDNYSEADLASLYEEIRGLAAEEQIRELENLSSSIKAELFQDFDETDYMEQFGRFMAVQYIIEHIQNCRAYPDFLEEVTQEAERMQGSSLLAQRESFSVRNMEAISEIYQRLPAAELFPDSSAGISQLTENKMLDFILLLIFSMLAYLLTVSEKKEGYYPLLCTMPKGRKKLYLGKMIALCTLVIGTMALFFATVVLIVQKSIGFCSMDIPVQSLDIYYQCPYEMSVGEYLFCFFVFKSFLYLTVSFLLLAIGTAASTYVSACCIEGGILLGSLFIQKAVMPYSAMGIFSEMSLTALLDTEHYFITAKNLNFFGYPVSSMSIGIVSVALYFVACFFFSFLKWGNASENRIPEGLTFRIKRKKVSFNRKNKLLYFECKKLFLTEHAWIFCVIFIAALAVLHRPVKFVGLEDYYYDHYSQQLTGKLSFEKKEYLVKEKERIETAEERINAYYEKFDKGEISQRELEYYLQKEEITTEQSYAFSKVEEQYEILEKIEEQGTDAVFLNQQGWEKVFGEEGRKEQLRDFLILNAFLIFCLHNFFSMEKISGVRKIAGCSPYGRRTGYYKIISAGILSGTAAVFLYLLQLVSIHASWELCGWNSLEIGIECITVNESGIRNIPILAFLIVQGGIRIIQAAVSSGIILLFSWIFEKPLMTIIFSYALLILPGIFRLIGIL